MTAVAEITHGEACTSGQSSCADVLLDWYGRERRELPWRAGPGERADPYRVWLSEVMLQQTTVKAAIPYFERFVQRWPSVQDLAAAEREQVLSMWAGLGYYSRANNLHLCAQRIVAEHGGVIPSAEPELRELPGIGPYTAAAVAAIAFDARATPVDGNIERVIARMFAVDTPLPGAKTELRRLAETLTPDEGAGDFAQALMDLGATVCTPKRPSCMICPLKQMCAANAAGLEAVLPYRVPRAKRPVRCGVAFLALREDGHILLRRRHPKGLLAGMTEVPSSEWREQWIGADEALRMAPVRADWWAVPGTVTHTFTHFRLELVVYRAVVPAEATLTLWADQERCRWVARRNLVEQALPSVMRKVIAHALAETK